MAHTTFMIGVRMTPAWIVSTTTGTSTTQVRARNGASYRARQGSHRRGRRRGSAGSFQALQNGQESALSLHGQGGDNRHEVLLGQGGQVGHSAIHEGRDTKGGRES